MRVLRKTFWVIFYGFLGLMFLGWVLVDLRGLVKWSANVILAVFVVLSLLAWWLQQVYKPSIEGMTRTISRRPNNPMAYYGRAMVYIKQDDFASARQDLSKALELDPEYVRAIVWRGITHDEMGDLEPALEDFDRALILDPENATALYNRGHVYQKQGQYEKALQDFHAALRISPGLEGLTEAIEILEDFKNGHLLDH